MTQNARVQHFRQFQSFCTLSENPLSESRSKIENQLLGNLYALKDFPNKIIWLFSKIFIISKFFFQPGYILGGLSEQLQSENEFLKSKIEELEKRLEEVPDVLPLEEKIRSLKTENEELNNKLDAQVGQLTTMKSKVKKVRFVSLNEIHMLCSSNLSPFFFNFSTIVL